MSFQNRIIMFRFHVSLDLRQFSSLHDNFKKKVYPGDNDEKKLFLIKIIRNLAKYILERRIQI